MFTIPTILFADEILDKAFKRASKVSVKEKDRLKYSKNLTIRKIQSVADTIDSTLKKYVKSFPNFDELHRFYFELIDVTMGTDKLRKSLGALDWCRKNVTKLARDFEKRVAREKSDSGVRSLQKTAYGRISSLVKQIGSDLEFLSEARKSMKKIPSIDSNMSTIVVAGYPNVGKSLLVRKISSGEPEVAPYPFTTKKISIGHFEKGRMKYQIIDTPGLLDRPMENRNDIERQAILALKHLGDVIVFVFDPSEYCGYHLKDQSNLLDDIKKIFGDIPMIEVENKADVMREEMSGESSRIRISSETGEGLEKLMEVIIMELERVDKKRKNQQSDDDVEVASQGLA